MGPLGLGLGLGLHPHRSGIWSLTDIANVYFIADPLLSAHTLSGSNLSSLSDAAGSGRTLTGGSTKVTLDTSTTWGPAARPTFGLTANATLYSSTGGITGAAAHSLFRVFRRDGSGYLAQMYGATSSGFSGNGSYGGTSILYGGHNDTASPDGQNYATGAGGAVDTSIIHVGVHTWDGSLSRVYLDGFLWQSMSRQVTNYGENPYALDTNYNVVAGYGIAPHFVGDLAVEHDGIMVWTTSAMTAMDLLRAHQWSAANLGTVGAPVGMASARQVQFGGGVNSRDNGYPNGAANSILTLTAALFSTPMNVSVLGVTGQTMAQALALNHALGPEELYAGNLSMLGPWRLADIGSGADNDLGCAGAAGSSLASAQANYLLMVANARAFSPGCLTIGRTMLPSANAARATTYDANMAAWNEWMRGGGAGVDIIADTGTIPALVSSVSNNASSLWADDAMGNIHLSPSGTALQAPVLAAAITARTGIT
jgi:hypothetical protein